MSVKPLDIIVEASPLPGAYDNADRPFSLSFFFLKVVPEAVKTVLRAIYLSIVFLPPLVTIPAIFFGRKCPEFDSERAGALWWYDLLVRCMEIAGATFIKLAQWASTRVDIFPPELCIRLSRLQSQVAPHSFEETQRAINKFFGLPIEEIFESFDAEPVGVGAIAQVYRATLHPRQVPPSFSPHDPPVCAVKVLHPRVSKTVNRDLAILLFLANIVHMLPGLHWFSIPDEVRTFGTMMRAQLDLRTEATNIERFTANFADRDEVSFPTVIRPFVSSRVMVETYETAIPLSKFLMSSEPTAADSTLAKTGLDCLLTMLAVDNFVHVDLHPGNILVNFIEPQPERGFLVGMLKAFQSTFFPLAQEEIMMPPSPLKLYDARRLRDLPEHEFVAAVDDLVRKGYKPHLVLLDCGLTSSLRTADLKNFLDLFRAVCEGRGYRAGELMVERSRRPETCTDKDGFARAVDSIVKDVFSRTLQLQNIGIGDILARVMHAVRNYHVQFEGEFVSVVVSIVLVEGIGRRLDPDLDLLDFAGKYLREVEKTLEGLGADLSPEEKRALDRSLWTVRAASTAKKVGKIVGLAPQPA
ncbi:ABC1 family-domain-containing protein [Hyaloraphidium curvatum]|nr:ABC1 family-domain-containing protein [Hyaloraphidium curvatum]